MVGPDNFTTDRVTIRIHIEDANGVAVTSTFLNERGRYRDACTQFRIKIQIRRFIDIQNIDCEGPRRRRAVGGSRGDFDIDRLGLFIVKGDTVFNSQDTCVRINVKPRIFSRVGNGVRNIQIFGKCRDADDFPAGAIFCNRIQVIIRVIDINHRGDFVLVFISNLNSEGFLRRCAIR